MKYKDRKLFYREKFKLWRRTRINKKLNFRENGIKYFSWDKIVRTAGLIEPNGAGMSTMFKLLQVI